MEKEDGQTLQNICKNVKEDGKRRWKKKMDKYCRTCANMLKEDGKEDGKRRSINTTENANKNENIC